MKTGISSSEFDAFRKFLKEACGIVLGDNKQYLVTSRLRALLDETGISSVSQLIKEVEAERNSRLKARIVDAMTTNETYWFRDQHPYLMLVEKLLPEIERFDRPTVRIWSAACSSGQEPYSISMVLQEYYSSVMRRKRDFEIVATDISPTMLSRAREGVYDELALARGMSPERREKYFVADGKNQWKLIEPVRKKVKFTELNLMRNFSSLGKFDVVFCRNVLIYFSAELKRDILNRIADVLYPDGYLFLGGSESMANYCDRFETVRLKGGLVYRVVK